MRVYIAGINGMVGSSLSRVGKSLGLTIIGHSSKEVNHLQRDLVFKTLSDMKPDVLIIAAAKVGGIGANWNYPVDFLSQNLQIATNLIDASHEAKISKVIFLGSSCIYPKFAEQPIKEESLMTGKLEETNEPYALAKIAGIKLIQSYNRQYNKNWYSLMPTNLYGPKDNFDLSRAHVVPALIRKIHLAKTSNASEVEVWGDGTPMREFLYVDDLAFALFETLKRDLFEDLINVGYGEEISIHELVAKVSNIIGFKGQIIYKKDLPNGTPRKLLDSSKIRKYGWKPTISLDEGLELTYKWFLNNLEDSVK